MPEYAIYQISLKLLLEKDERVLMVRGRDGFLDFPGGRIDPSEIHVPLPAVLEREIKEELGETIRYALGTSVFQFVRHLNDQREPVFVVVFGSKYLSGSIQLSSEHQSYEWIDPSRHSFSGSDFFSKEEYSCVTSYLARQTKESKN